MEVTHVIFFHDKPFRCKECENGVLITPVNPEGEWQCPKCGYEQKILTELSIKFKE